MKGGHLTTTTPVSPRVTLIKSNSLNLGHMFAEFPERNKFDKFHGVVALYIYKCLLIFVYTQILFMTKHFLRQWRNTVRGGGGDLQKSRRHFRHHQHRTGSTSSPSTGKIRRWIIATPQRILMIWDLFCLFLCFPVFFLSFSFLSFSYPFSLFFLSFLFFPFLFWVDKFSGACFLYNV